jgi:hypothetical protein
MAQHGGVDAALSLGGVHGDRRAIGRRGGRRSGEQGGGHEQRRELGQTRHRFSYPIPMAKTCMSGPDVEALASGSVTPATGFASIGTAATTT